MIIPAGTCEASVLDFLRYTSWSWPLTDFVPLLLISSVL